MVTTVKDLRYLVWMLDLGAAAFLTIWALGLIAPTVTGEGLLLAVTNCITTEFTLNCSNVG